jgi:hypothetical protein
MNQLPNTAKESKSGRFWLSPYHLMEAKHNLEIANSQVKRGERASLGDFEQHAWGCTCCVCVLESPERVNRAQEEKERIAVIYEKKKGRRQGFFEIGGKILKHTVLSNGSVVLPT